MGRQMLCPSTIPIPTDDLHTRPGKQVFQEVVADEAVATEEGHAGRKGRCVGHGKTSTGKVDGIFAGVRSFPTILFVVFSSLVLSYPLADTDIWWHLSAGREIFRTGHLLRFDSFCSSSTGTPWTDLHWGFQLVVWKLWTILGDQGLVAMRIVLSMGALGIAFARRWNWPAALAGSLCLWLSRSFVDARPILFTLVLLAVLQRFLESDPPLRKIRTVLVGTVVQIGLVNSQGLFLLGPLFAIGFAVGDLLDGCRDVALRKMGLAGLLLVVSLVNPWSLQAFDLAGKLAERIVPGGGNLFSSEIPENAPLWRWTGEDPVRIVSLVWLGIALWIGWRRGVGSKSRLVLLGAMGLLSILAVRNLPLLCLEIAYCLELRNLKPLVRIWSWSTALVASSFMLLAVQQRQWDLPDSSIAPLRLPGDETIALVKNSRDSLFHEIRAGGWLTWETKARGVCWCDTRMVLHDQGFVANYLEVADHPEAFPAFADRNGFGYALLPVVEFPRFHNLVVWLLRSPDWQVVHCDGAWILFGRRSPFPAKSKPLDLAAIDGSLARRFGSNPALKAMVHRRWQALLLESGVREPSAIALPRDIR
jgi:hypothetical protein